MPQTFTAHFSPAHAIGTLSYDDGSAQAVSSDFPVVLIHPGWGAWLEVRADGYQTQRHRGALPPYPPGTTDPMPTQITLVEQPTLSRLRIEGRHFVNDQGRVNVVGATLFQAYDRWLRGDLDPAVFDQLQQKGFNLIRVFGMDYNIPIQMGRPPFRPQEFGDRFYTEIPSFCNEAAAHGLYVWWCVFADTGLLMPNQGEQNGNWARTADQWRAVPNAIGQLVNEGSVHQNYVDKTKFPHPGVPYSAASEGDGYWMPVGDFFDYHPRRSYPTHIKDCCVVDNPNYTAGRPVLLGEPDGFGSPKPDGSPRNTNLEHIALSAGASVESSMGYVFHSQNGIYAMPFDAQTEPFADECVRVLRGR